MATKQQHGSAGAARKGVQRSPATMTALCGKAIFTQKRHFKCDMAIGTRRAVARATPDRAPGTSGFQAARQTWGGCNRSPPIRQPADKKSALAAALRHCGPVKNCNAAKPRPALPMARALPPRLCKPVGPLRRCGQKPRCPCNVGRLQCLLTAGKGRLRAFRGKNLPATPCKAVDALQG